ncbi:hypothetical protein CDIK_3805 [Cucumispora dikerogammari]|nr:hypothetical protein CDIK_3805 [Cucumispora dikerogammari]
MLIKASFENVNFLIASIKSITIKNKTNEIKLGAIGKLPDVVITSWASWLKAANFYTQNFSAVQNTIFSFVDDGILITKAKKSLKDINLSSDLAYIYENYSCFITFLDWIENESLFIESIFEKNKSLTFKEDKVLISKYILKRLNENDTVGILNMEFENLNLAVFLNLKRCPETTIAVERAFSMLKNILVDNRHFTEANLKTFLLIISTPKNKLFFIIIFFATFRYFYVFFATFFSLLLGCLYNHLLKIRDYKKMP